MNIMNVIAIENASEWVSLPKEQTVGLPEWTKFTPEKIPLGSLRLDKLSFGAFNTSTDKLYLAKKTTEELDLATGSEVYLKNDEYPNGIQLGLGDSATISSIEFRHFPSVSDDNATCVGGHSLSQLTFEGLTNYERSLEKFNDAYSFFAIANGPEVDSNVLSNFMVDDSPLQDSDGNIIGKSMVIDGANENARYGISYQIKDGYRDLIEKNKFHSFFYKHPSDVDFPVDDDGNELSVVIAIFNINYDYYYDTYIKKAYHVAVLFENPDGSLTIRYGRRYYNDYHGTMKWLWYTNNDDNVYTNTSEEGVITKGEWNHIVFQVLDDDSWLLYKDNEVVTEGNSFTNSKNYNDWNYYYSEYAYAALGAIDIIGPSTKYLESNDLTYGVIPNGWVFSQYEFYLGVYDNDNHYNYFIKPDSGFYNQSVIEFDISDAGLSQAPVAVYKNPENDSTFNFSLTSDENTNFINYKPVNLDIQESNIDADYNYGACPTLIDSFVYKFDEVTSETGSYFQTKYIVDKGIAINSGHVIELRV